MIERRAALAVFVKTPGLSPVKTRLAAGIGQNRAEEFFGLSLAAVEATAAAAAESAGICPYWAVAEERGLENPRWKGFPRVHQGSGNLGERLARVFADLQLRHEIVVAIGADSPQITASIIREAVEYLRQSPPSKSCVLGRCHDGGFYLVGTNHSLSPETWRDVPYGTPVAADHIATNLANQGTLHELTRLSDVDQVHDLAVLSDELKRIDNLFTEQRVILKWAVAMLGTK